MYFLGSSVTPYLLKSYILYEGIQILMLLD